MLFLLNDNGGYHWFIRCGLFFLQDNGRVTTGVSSVGCSFYRTTAELPLVGPVDAAPFVGQRRLRILDEGQRLLPLVCPMKAVPY